MNLSFLQRGAGEDLVFLHGYLASKESFYPQINYFSKFYRVTALDFPGMGQAEPLPAAWSVGDYALWTKEALCSLGITRPRVIAHSFGGRVAIKLLSEDFFERAVLTGCAGIIKKRNLCYRFRVRSYKICKKFAPKFAEKHFGSGEYRTLSLHIYLENIEGSRLKVLKNCGHFPFLDDPLAFNMAAEEFLRCQTHSSF